MGLAHVIHSANDNVWGTMKIGRRKARSGDLSSIISTGSLVRALDTDSEGTGFEPRVDHLFGQLAGDTAPATATQTARWQQQHKTAYWPATANDNVRGTMKIGRGKARSSDFSSRTSTGSLVRALDIGSEGTGFEPRVDHLFGQLAGNTAPATATQTARWRQQHKTAYWPATANDNVRGTVKTGRPKARSSDLSSITSTGSLVRALDADSEGTGFEPRVDHLFGQLAGDTAPATATQTARWQQQHKTAYWPTTVESSNGEGREGKGADNW